MSITDLSAENLESLELAPTEKLVIQIPAGLSAEETISLRDVARAAVGPTVKILMLTGGDSAPAEDATAYVYDSEPSE